MVLRAIDSVLNQSHKNLELIVVDDGSTDKTANYVRRYEDDRIKYVYQKNRGVSAARNLGVSQAQADWICFLDSDDVWRRHKLSEQLRFHDQNRPFLFSQTDDVWIRNSERVNKMKIHEVREGDIFESSLRRCLICCSSVMIKKSLFEDVGGFDENLVTCEDYDLWLKVLAKHPVGFVDKKLVTKFGGHPDQLSKHYSVMDQYRVASLEKLLSSGILSNRQREMVASEILHKKAIIEKGRKKRA